MGIITRPSGGFVAGNIAYDTDVDGDFDTMYAEFNGNIDNSNVKVGAGIFGNKLASKPNGVTSTQINDKAVTSVELANDAAVDASRAVGSDHIKNLAILFRHVKISSFDYTPGGSVVSKASQQQSTGITTSTGIPVGVSVVKAGGPSTTLSVGFGIDSGTNTYYIYVGNASELSVSLTGYTFRFLYIPTA